MPITSPHTMVNSINQQQQLHRKSNIPHIAMRPQTPYMPTLRAETL
jgi:hypothetical protein